MIIKSQISFLKSILYLSAIIQDGSISKAAEHNGIKATNLSRMIKDLEDTIGMPLLIRKSNGVLPTQAALLLNEKAIQLKESLKQVQMLKKAKNKQKVLKVYLSEGLSLNFLKEFVLVKIKYTTQNQDFHLGIFSEPPELNEENKSYQVGEYDLTCNGLVQKIWIVCQTDNTDACILADFIVSKLFP